MKTASPAPKTGHREPAWLETLRDECASRPQSAVAQACGLSSSTINQILKGNYRANTRRIQAKVEGALMGKTLKCPVYGELPRNRCIEFQQLPFAISSPQRVQLFHACKTCPNNKSPQAVERRAAEKNGGAL